MAAHFPGEHAMPSDHDAFAAHAERRHWETLAAAAARDLPPGRIGGVIAQLRQRGHVATRRASLFLGVLLATVAIGLAYYIGLPLLRAFADGAVRTSQEQVDAARAESAALDLERAEAAAALREALFLAPETVLQAVGAPIHTPLRLADGALIATTRTGAVLRSDDGGETWRETRPGLARFGVVDPAVVLSDGALVMRRQWGPALRSVDGGSTWSETAVPFDVPEPPGGSLVLADGALIALSGDGTLARSTDGGSSWTSHVVGDGLVALPVIVGDGVLVGVDQVGAILRSEDGGATWAHARIETSRAAVLDEFIGAPAPLNARTIVAAGMRGTILLSEDAGLTWREVHGASGEGLNAPVLVDDATLLATGFDGRILRSADGGKTWSEARPAPASQEGFAIPIARVGAALIALASEGTILGSTDAGASWRQLRARSGSGAGFGVPLALEDTLIAPGEEGMLLRISSGARIRPVPEDLPAGGEGDAELAAFADALDPEVRAAEPVAEALRVIDRIASRRGSVDDGLIRAQERLEAWRSGAARPEVERRAFAAFMESCRAGAAEPEGAALTIACLDAYAASEADTQRQWWQTVAEQAPQGILFLFLLATLSGLYRYNLRLAGFHNGRADALELMVAQVDKDLLTPVADALAADKVEFGAAKTPTDHAAEMATALINRAKP
mgnify:CR=1 FL=1